MKKIRKIVILTIIFVLSVVLNVYAADYATNELIQITLKPTSTQVKPGDTISIVVAGKTQSELEGISAILKYDSTKLQYTGHTIHEYYIDLTGKDDETKEINLFTMYGSLTAPETAPSEADLLTLNFKVLDEAVEGETLSVKLSTVSAGDFMYEDWVDLSDKEVSLTVVGKGTQTPGDGEQNPDQGEQTPDGGGQNPDQGEQTPDGGEQNPDQGEQTPCDEEQNSNKNEKPKDETIADKPINHAGSETYAYIMMGAIVVIAIVLYAKCKKYSDVK